MVVLIVDRFEEIGGVGQRSPTVFIVCAHTTIPQNLLKLTHSVDRCSPKSIFYQSQVNGVILKLLKVQVLRYGGIGLGLITSIPWINRAGYKT